MGDKDARREPGPLDASGDFPVADRSVSAERRRIDAPAAPLARDELAVPAPPLCIGQLIADKYRLKRTIGEGGMGLVWIALNEDLDADVALKVLRPEARKSVRAQVAERMLVEARAAARLGHPAIVRVLDLGRTDQGDPFLVMELLEGENLADVIEKRGRMDAIEAVRTLLPIVHATVAAHEKRIIHRDLKPENIILSVQPGGAIQPKLIDFGVAKVTADSADKITQMGMLVGSPGYMSPEQGRGDPVDPRSDVWSMCIVLHELVTGQVPFRRNHPYAILRAILEEQLPDLRQAGFDDDALAAIVKRGLEKEPEDRWQSMHELGVTLARWLVDKGIFDDICGASLDVTWFRARVSIPDGMATFKERSPSLGALARMREETRETPLTPPPPKAAGSDVPVALGAGTASSPPPLPRRSPFTIVAGLTIAAVALGLIVYSQLRGPNRGAAPSNASTALASEPPRSDGAASRTDSAAPPHIDADARPSISASPAPSAHEDKPAKTKRVGEPGSKGAGANSTPSAPSATGSAPSAAQAPPPPPPPTADTPTASPLKRPEL